MKMSSRIESTKKISYDDKKIDSKNRDKKLFILIGMILGDGHIARFPRTERLTISLNSNNSRLVNRYASIVEKIFKKKPIDVYFALRSLGFNPHHERKRIMISKKEQFYRLKELLKFRQYLLGSRLMVGLKVLDLNIMVRIHAPQQIKDISNKLCGLF